MTSSPIDPALSVPGSFWSAQPGRSISDMAEHRNGHSANGAEVPPSAETSGSEVQWVNTELNTIASTIEALQSRLEQANARLNSVSTVETTEVEIGRLFLEAQRFSEDSLANLEVKVHQILREAESKAKEILAEATEEAQEIQRQAQYAAFASTRTVRELQAAIAGFTTVNAELLRELGSLNTILTSDGQQPVRTIDSVPTSAPD